MECDRIPREKGVYLLEVITERDVIVERGMLSGARIPAGRYLYLGSAGGPGGLRSRICRHVLFGEEKKPRWHIDWLLRAGSVPRICYLPGQWGRRAEERLSKLLLGLLEEALPRFGSTDTRSRTHLFRLSMPHGFLLEELRAADEGWVCLEVA